MNRSLRNGRYLWLALFFISSTGLFAQGGYGPPIAAAGGAKAANATLHLSGTFGQPIIGTTTNLGFIAWQGFWTPPTPSRLSANELVSNIASTENFSLQCFPNPVSKSATISFFLGNERDVSLTLHDALGREVTNLMDHQLHSGDTRLSLNTEEIPSGWYTLILSAGDNRMNLPVHIVQ